MGRDPASIRRSLMVPLVIGRSPSELATRRRRIGEIFPRVPADAAGWRAAGFLYGTPADVRRDLQEWRRRGLARVMLQMLDMHAAAAFDLIAREIVPAFS